MPYIGRNHVAGDHTSNFKVLDDISSYTATFNGSLATIISTADNTIRIPEHRFIQGQRVTYSNGGGGNIGGLTNGTAYFVTFDTANTFKLATSLANANNNTNVNLSSVGSGSSHTLTAAFDGTNTKFKLTHNGGESSRLNNATQLQVAINNVLQRPNIDPNNFTEGFAVERGNKIVFQTAPTSNDVFWGSIIANTLETFDISDNKVENFTGDGSTTEFNLSRIPPNNGSIVVTINGVLQHSSDATTARAYSLSSQLLIFTSAPANGDEIQVRHIGFAGASTGQVSGFYGRTGNVTLTANDHITTGDITSRNINSSGIITATSFVGSGANLTGIDATAVKDASGNVKIQAQASGAIYTGIHTFTTLKSSSGDFSGNVSIGGTLTYEDVTNIDSVGIITARSSIYVADSIIHQGDTDTKIDFATNRIKLTATNRLRIDLTSNGYNTFYGSNNSEASSTYPKGTNATYVHRFRDTEGDDTEVQFFNTNVKNTILSWNDYGNSTTAGNLVFKGVVGGSGLEHARFTGSGNFNLLRDLDVDGHTNLDNVSIAGVTTFSGVTNHSAISNFAAQINLTDGYVNIQPTINSATSPALAVRNNSQSYPTIQQFSNTNAQSAIIQWNTTGQSGAGNFIFRTSLSGNEEFARFTKTGNLNLSKDLDVDGHTNLDNTNIVGVATVSTRLNINTVSNAELAVAGTNTAWRGIFMIKDNNTNSTAMPYMTFWNGNEANDGSNTGLEGRIGLVNGGAVNERFDIHSYRTGTSLSLGTQALERLRIDSGGRVLIGTPTAAAGLQSQEVYGGTSALQIQGTNGPTSSISLLRHGNSPYLILGSTGGGALNSVTALSDDDRIGQITFAGADGTDVNTHAASIAAYVDGSVSSNTVPGRLTFQTSTGVSELTRMTILSGGQVGINEASNINGRLHVQHDALNENILYATRYNDQSNDKPIFAVTEATMDGFVDSGLVIGSHNRSIRLGAVFDNNAGVTTSTAGGITINLSATGASAAVNNIGINTGRPANALVVKHSEPTIRLVNTSIPNAPESGRIRFTEYDTDYQGAFIHYDGELNKFHLGTHSPAGNSAANDVNVMTIDRDSGITTFRNNVQFYGNAIRLPTRTSNPGSVGAGDAYFNTAQNAFKIYDGSSWGSVVFAAKGSQQNPATSPSDLAATGALAQYYFSPDGGTAFQQYACGALSNLGTIPSGGPSWVGNISSLVIIHKAQVGTTASMIMSRANYLKFIEESDNRTNNTNYIYWSVWDNGTLWGITRTRWTGITYSTWASAHGSQGVDNSTLNGTPVWDVWKTGSGTAGGNISSGSYTVSNDNNLVRAVLPGDPHQGSANNRGLHYKRTGSGEHYPWFDGNGNITDNGYFYPSSSYYMATDSRYQHYLFLSDT